MGRVLANSSGATERFCRIGHVTLVFRIFVIFLNHLVYSSGISLRILSENGPEVISIKDLLQFTFHLNLNVKNCFAVFEQKTKIFKNNHLFVMPDSLLKVN